MYPEEQKPNFLDLFAMRPGFYLNAKFDEGGLNLRDYQGNVVGTLSRQVNVKFDWTMEFGEELSTAMLNSHATNIPGGAMSNTLFLPIIFNGKRCLAPWKVTSSTGEVTML